MKTSTQLERHMKGVASYRRIDILALLKKNPGLTLEEISEKLEAGIQTIAVHTKSLVHAGLLNKKHKGRFVLHTLSPYGQKITNFLSSF